MEYERLKQRVEDQQKLQEQEKERQKKKPNVLMEEETGKMIGSFDFWCDDCQEDFSSWAYKTSHRLYGDRVAVWRTQCPICEEECIRLITHKDEDPYYYKSSKIRRQRNEYSTDLLQAEEYGFKSYYGNVDEEKIKKLEMQEQRFLEDEWDIGLKGKSFKTKQALIKRNKKMQGK